MLICFGTRPEYIKIKPIINTFNKNIPYKILFTGQHPDLLSHLDVPAHRIFVKEGGNRLDTIMTSILNNEDIFKDITSVMVQGDTTSAFALSLAAFHRKIPIIHLEAGLRTYNINHPYPEEFNRQAISRLADYNLCPTTTCKQNLEKEKVHGKNFIVGNTVLDNLVEINPSYNNDVIITLHRRENHHWIKEWFKQIDILAKNHKELNFILPIHPNPNVIKHRSILRHVKVIDPVPYEKFIKMLANCKFAITDSGGLQEELSFFGKLCIVCRKKTERIEGVGTFSYLCKKPEDLEKIFMKINKNYNCAKNLLSPYGDGQSSKKILKLIKDGYVTGI